MLVCAAGDIHGALDRLYADVTAFEASIGACFDWILHVGDFGVWPDRERVDGATRRHDGAGDFPAWLAARRPVPRRTVFIKGNHEDFVWLDAQNLEDPAIAGMDDQALGAAVGHNALEHRGDLGRAARGLERSCVQ